MAKDKADELKQNLAEDKAVQAVTAEVRRHAPMPQDLEQQLQLLLERDARREAELRGLRVQLAELAGRPPIEPVTTVPEDYKAWASLGAAEKTQLVADRVYPPAEGTRPWEVQLVYNPKRGQGGKVEAPPSEHPRVRLHAHSDHEARALYQELCGITGYNQEETTLECAAAT